MISLEQGQTLNMICRFSHRGKAWSSAKIRGSIGNKGFFGFDEILHREVEVSGIGDDLDWTQYQVVVDVAITEQIAAGSYEVEVKLLSIPGPDIFWSSPPDDVVIIGGEEPLPSAEFQNLQVTYAKA